MAMRTAIAIRVVRINEVNVLLLPRLLGIALRFRGAVRGGFGALAGPPTRPCAAASPPPPSARAARARSRRRRAFRRGLPRLRRPGPGQRDLGPGGCATG